MKNLVSLKGQFDQNVQEKSEKLELAFSHISEKNKPFKYIETISDKGIKLVKRVFDQRSNREVVYASLKDSNNTEKYQYSIINDAWVTSQLEHPNIPPIYEVGTDGDKPYFTMKLLKGQTLSEKLKDKNLLFHQHEKYYLHIIQDICNALAYAHSKGILHLDIKADNIYINSYNEVMLFDWGCAIDFPIDDPDPNFELIRSLLHSSRVEGSIRGTLNYMSPEQAKGNIEDFGPYTDIFLMGGLLYHIITGQSLYEHTSSDKKFEAAENVDIQNIRVLNPKCSNRLAGIVTKALSEDPETRYESVIELSKDLNAYLEGEQLSFESWSPITATRIFLKQNPKLSLSFAVLLLLVTVISFFTAWFTKRSERNTQMVNQVLTHSNQKQERLLKQLSSISTISDSNYLNVLFEKDNLFQIETLLLFKPNNADFWFDKARVYCGNFQFAKAKIAFEKSLSLCQDKSESRFRKTKNLQMLDYIKAHEKDYNLEKLKQDEILEIITSLRDMKTHCLMFRTIYQKVFTKQKQQIKFLTEAIKHLNKNSDIKITTQIINQQIHLDLSKNPQLRNPAPLFHFPAYHLNISNTPINRLYPLISPSLRELNISNTQIVDYTWLTHMLVHKLSMDNNTVAYFNLKSLPFIEELSIFNTVFISYNTGFFLHLMSNLVSLTLSDASRIIGPLKANYFPDLTKISFPYHKKFDNIMKDPNFSHIHFNIID